MSTTGPADRLDAIQAILARLGRELADDPNVQSVGFGLRRRAGTLSDERVIVFFVRRKYGSDRQLEVAGTRRVPAEIDGFATDVQEFDVRPASAGVRDDMQFDPLVGGPASSNAANHIAWFNGSGTLGLLVRDATDGTPMALSNWHVWGDGGEAGDDIIQPGHPTTGDHLEAVGKVAACGPLVTSLIEWEVPSPLTAGLYGGAAAAAVAAAASDVRDPGRRGQDATVPGPDEVTTAERVSMDIGYPQLPLPGVPFRTDVTWHYERTTSAQTMTHDVTESTVNTQFLLGKLVTTERTRYQPGETVRLLAAIWDYQPRSCADYHVVAHLIPARRPTTALRTVLRPTACPRTVPIGPPDRPRGGLVCVSFEQEALGERPAVGKLEWLQYASSAGDPLHVVDWLAPTRALTLGSGTLTLGHVPARRVEVTVAQLTGTPVVAVATNASGQVVDRETAPDEQGVAHRLVLEGDGIVRVVLRGGGGEGLLVRYCIEPVEEGGFTTAVPARTLAAVQHEHPDVAVDGSRVTVRRCCFAGEVDLPPDEPAGGWDVYLTVQNVNDVPDGVPPEIAATTIGGHLLSAHTAAEVVACTAIMLSDHVFDVI
ncbi:hypothetical protein [Cellulosimicrobium arenosum]|uniref:Uncharacterized protein n=1 Tax=Cellulosimicrobium arenosum TaxID=2708133 RepID=A0A927G7X0_9MICO|nr:hypothetical protein [Cellulosimicrobium arenosum]MBD8078350.1 hypothetical protein [Cellulosimicrobium arenosum]